MFSYFSVFDKIWCTFFPEHFYRPVGHWFSQKRRWFLSAGCLAAPAVVVWNRSVSWEEDFGNTAITYKLDWTEIQFLLHHLSYLIIWEVKDWNWFNYIQVLFRFHCQYDLMLTFVFVTAVLHYTVDFTLIHLLHRENGPAKHVNCRLEVPRIIFGLHLHSLPLQI